MSCKNKEDRKKYNKQYYIKNRGGLLKQKKQYYIDNREEVTQCHRTWAKNNKEKIKEYMKEWYKENKDYCAKCSKEYHQKNREQIREYRKVYYEKNKEYFKKTVKKCRKENKEHFREYSKRYLKTDNGKAAAQRGRFKRKTRERNIINTLTAQEWLDILEKYNYRCAYCGVEFDCENLPAKDHVIPISKGGDNTKENIVPACRSCNSKKGTKILSERRIYVS